MSKPKGCEALTNLGSSNDSQCQYLAFPSTEKMTGITGDAHRLYK